MAFGEEKHKKSTFEIVTLVIVVVMVVATLAGLILPAINALKKKKTVFIVQRIYLRLVFKLLNVCFFKILSVFLKNNGIDTLKMVTYLLALCL